MIHKTLRIGRFTSSNIHKLVSMNRSGNDVGEPFNTYVEEKRAERCLGRSIDMGAYSQEMVWGKVMEWYLFEHVLGLSYNLVSKDTEVHPKYPFWSGSPDATNDDINSCVEIKCYYPKKFFQITRMMISVNEGWKKLEDFKKEFKEEYWQVLSNAVILNKPMCELIVFTPTEEQLNHVKQLVEETNTLEKLGIELWKGRFIYEKNNYELPFIPEHSDYPNMVKLTFEPTKEDIEFLTERVKKAEEKLSN